ncbi:hypothetical protein B4109_1892 [Geobacillus stearothermophilus]|uniref:Uncharacterized protein n=1 Tax=Geobacillus stearothermophilus TaxID=1422 RepID=A0A150M594_GEOSE|nr:hypothetical protein B4109_1892 [Geobacillus stearothermophilus]
MTAIQINSTEISPLAESARGFFDESVKKCHLTSGAPQGNMLQ